MYRDDTDQQSDLQNTKFATLFFFIIILDKEIHGCLSFWEQKPGKGTLKC